MLLLTSSAQKEIVFSTKTMFSQIREGKFTENIPFVNIQDISFINIQDSLFSGMIKECTILIFLIFKLIENSQSNN